ncbi:AAA family ATPase [Aliarcobacter cibarius]|uniref:SMC family ATPase n=1 Tax=Aliarcobacter cibarius TaxID=255507 RepID=A0A7L5JQ03_9BACT|nr:SMC family ATPase [Aliarcobacter cibarius]QKJ27323.1 SbcCD-like exonuclease, ATPase subunit [Aliarcobacter cibarius]TLS95545.1 SMC family ATPase [Aliarcobacter cibarius]TLS96036.1 SMC family ATPase [Aliarcobacter cibarius]
MILTKLKLENFKKYRFFEISFDLGLIGIIGKNGSGKSTIFEAILFALYGELKNKGDKEVVRNANALEKDIVSVELEFEIEETIYKIVREFRGKTLSANAKLYKNEELITTGAKEVTIAIVNLTKMSKDAFMHTLFASQKELTSLSNSKPEDRKKMIRKLLGLEKIDFVEKELIEKSRELKREIDAFKEVLLSSEDITIKKENIVEQTVQKEEFLKDIDKQSLVLDELNKKVFIIKQELEQLTKTKEQKQILKARCEILTNSISSHQKTQEKLQNELNALYTKQEELKGLQTIKQEYITLHETLKEQDKLKEYSLRKDGLLLEQKELREQYTKAKDSIKVLEFETKEHLELVEKEKELDNSIEKYKLLLTNKGLDEKRLIQEIAGEEKLIADIKKKIENITILGKESNCPTCTRPLLDEYDSVIFSLEQIVIKVENEKIDISKEQLANIKEEKEKLEEIQKANIKEHFEISKKINLIENKKRDLQALKEHFEKVTQKGVKNKEELAKLEIYNYDKNLHEELLLKQKELKSKYEYILSLETMLKRVDSIKEELKTSILNQDKYNLELLQKDLEYKAINYDEVKHKEKLKEFDEVQKQKDSLVTLINDLKVKIATIQGQIKTIQESLQNNETQLKKVQTKKDDLNDYEKIKINLAEFKTKLNSKVAPRISDIASNMFAQITKGKYQHIEVSNEFDFYIYDEGKKYPIERFSGGEIDLANLVLRIAISKTLSELSGANSVEFLAFDEVFGSQDDSRRMEILEAFHTIKEQYRQIFLISHEVEIKEMFERVVEV